MNNSKTVKALLAYMIGAEYGSNPDQDILTYEEIKQYMIDLDSELETETDFTFDFEGTEHRIIAADEIDQVMVDEIFNGDHYLLGCFNTSFIVENSDLNEELVKACKDSEAYEAIGKALDQTLSDDQKLAFVQAYASADTYGHHFNHWDGSESEINGFYVFRQGA